MTLPPFALERYFAKHEFSAPFTLSPSDCESLAMQELLEMADPQAGSLWSSLRLGYTETQGHPLLREEVSRLYRRIDPGDAIIAAPEEAIFVVMHALLRPGDEVVVVVPAYQSLHEVARTLGCRVVTCPLTAAGDRWRLDVDRLMHLAGPRTRLLVVNFPHNPTGALPSPEDWQALIGHARRHGMIVLSDEMYRLLEYDAASRLPALCDDYERGISLSGLSKTFGLPGLRIGWLATRDRELAASFQVVKDYTTLCSSAPSEILAVIALRAGEKILARNRGIIRGNLDVAAEFFRRHRGRFAWRAPLAGPVALPELTSGESADEFCRSVLEALNLMIVPGSLLGAGERTFRLGLGRKSFPGALAQLEEWLRAPATP